MNNVLVTGGCGFIGRHLVRRLLGDNMRVTVLDDFSTGRPDLLPSDPNLTILRGCATDGEAVRAAVRDAGRIFHLASVVGQLNVCRAPDWTVRVSTESVRQLNYWAPDAELVLFSSSAVYGLTSARACREDAPLSEAAVLDYDGGERGYAFAKFRAEQIAAERRPGTALVIRPFNVVGPGQTDAYGMVMPRFVRNALEGEPMTIYGDGTQRRSFGDVEAFIGHMLRLTEAWSAGDRGLSTFNVGSGTETSINALAGAIERVLNARTERLYYPYDQIYPGKRDVQRRRPSLDRIEGLLGPLAWPPLDDTIVKVAAAIRSESKRVENSGLASLAAD